MTGFALDPLDTLFFRDGTPFSSNSSSQDEVGGQFPPSPLTITGAMRAAFARCAGWDGHSPWSSDLKSVLGDGADDLGVLSFTGPFVVYEGKMIYPMPVHVVGDSDSGTWIPQMLLRPGQPVCCDLGEAVRLPSLSLSCTKLDSTRELRPADELWVNKDGFSSILMCQPPSEKTLVSPQWESEVRIGLSVDSETRTAIDSQLYSVRHTRLRQGVRLAVFVDGLPDSWAFPDRQLIPLGGESRVAECSKWDEELRFDVPVSEITSTGRLALIALTPLDIPPPLIDSQVQTPELDAGLRVISACIGRPLRIGGWESSTRSPLTLSSMVPPGSVVFCEATDARALANFLNSTGTNGYLRIGNRQKHGFGLVAITTWSEEEE